MSEPIRVLQVFGRLDRGGAETFIMNVYRNIDRSKVQFDFIVHTADKCAYDDEITALGGRIFRVPRYNGKNHFRYKKEWNLFFRQHTEYKIIHAHIRSTAAIFLNIAKKYGLVTISHSHNDSSGKGFSATIKNILQYSLRNIADFLFACSKQAGEWLYGKKACAKKNFHVIPNAIDTEKFIYDPVARESKRKELSLENKFVVGHIGRFDTQKNHDFIVNIFEKIYRKNNKAVLLLVGDGTLRSKIEQKVETFGLKDNVIFAGVRSDVPDLLNTMDVFLFPSLWEGFGIVLLEAQATGLRCVVSDVVSQEVKITKLLECVSLEKSASHWADKVLAYVDGYERKNMQQEIGESGFDIQEVAKWLENFYIK